MVKGGDIGDFGGGSLEHPKQWLCAQWAGLALGVPSCAQSHEARPEEVQEPSWALPRLHFDHAAWP
eukprot:scaffold38022_cov48-Phaeocystis_antarctica.AAC.3